MKIKPEDFILNQNIKPENIDYKIAEELATQIHNLSLLTEKCYTIFDYFKNQYYYISQNADFLCHGNSLEKKGYQFLINNFDEEDIVLMHYIQQRAFKFLQKIDAEERTNYIFSVYVRMICNGQKYDTNYRIKPHILDSKGNIWLSLAVLSRADKYIRPHLQNIETGEIILFKPIKPSELNIYLNSLSKQEMLVLDLMAESLSTEKIWNKLNIAEPTYKRHRREIYKKLGVDSKLSALNRAFVYGIIN